MRPRSLEKLSLEHDRAAWLKSRGLWECDACHRWTFDTKVACDFHYRRCEG